MSTHRQKLGVYLEPEVINQIRSRCTAEGIAAEAQPGRAGGPADWVRRLIHRELGIELPGDPHQQQSVERRGQPKKSPARSIDR